MPTSHVAGPSTRGAPIVVEQFGRTGPVLAVICAIHGNERSAVTFGERFRSALLGGWADRQGVRVRFVGAANPDGIAAGIRENARGVDLNRNFPAANFLAGGTRGSEPASEPETRALMGVLETPVPDAVVTMHCCEPMLDWDGPAENLAEAMAAAIPEDFGFPVDRLGPGPGSMGTWLGRDRQIPVVTFEFACHGEAPLIGQLEAAEEALGAAADWIRDTSTGQGPEDWPPDPPSDGPGDRYHTFCYGTSAGGLDLIAERIGPSAPAPSMLVAGLADTRRRSLHVAEHVRRVVLQASAGLEHPLIAVTSANPDGVASSRTGNADGCDVAAAAPSGAPASPEARHLRELVAEVDPDTVISVEAGESTAVTRTTEGPFGPVFERADELIRMEVGQSHGEGRGADEAVPSPRRFSRLVLDGLRETSTG